MHVYVRQATWYSAWEQFLVSTTPKSSERHYFPSNEQIPKMALLGVSKQFQKLTCIKRKVCNFSKKGRYEHHILRSILVQQWIPPTPYIYAQHEFFSIVSELHICLNKTKNKIWQNKNHATKLIIQQLVTCMLQTHEMQHTFVLLVPTTTMSEVDLRPFRIDRANKESI
jgi:hypothetical protein